MTVVAARVLGLDHPSATEVGVSGAKGAGLARAQAAGLPVLDGFVVAAAASVDALASGQAVLASGGSGAARLAIIRGPFDAALEADIATAAAAAGLPEPLIVRSSSVLEGAGRWSGAFTSVTEVACDEIPKATRSVWATCFAPDVIDRCAATGIEPGSAPMGVLVQPEISPDFGGTAAVDAQGAVTVTAVEGSPRDLVAGWVPGVRAVVENGAVAGQEAVDLMGGAVLGRVVELALQVQAELGHNLVEWAVRGGQVVLLQVQTSAVAPVPEPVAIPAALGHPFARDLACVTHRYPGPLGEELVLGWLPGLLGTPMDPSRGAEVGRRATTTPPRINGGAVTERAEALALAAELTGEAWGEPPPQAVARARLVLRRLRSDRPNESIEALRELRPVDPRAAARLLGMYERLAAATTTGRRGRDRWEPLLAGVAALQGEVYHGRGSVGGIGAGRLVWVDSLTRTDHIRPRDIVVAQYPLPNFSPLLWDAAGVVTVGGAASAHLFEVARSLTVPAVVDCSVAAVVRRGPVLGVVDGDSGRVAILR
ncbi:MAG: PEP/pyruvate-binding domain-containing protein [Acidimicrobiales bacterium]